NGPFHLLLPLFIAIVVLAALYRLAPKAPRKRLRRSVVLYVLYVVLVGVTHALAFFDAWPVLRSGFGVAVETLEILIIVNLSALALFDLLLHFVRCDYPDILHDLTVGA